MSTNKSRAGAATQQPESESPQHKNENRMSRSKLVVLSSFVGLITLGGVLLLVWYIHSSHQARIVAANDRISRAVATASEWLTGNSLLEGQIIEQTLDDALKDEVATERDNGIAMLSRIQQRRKQFAEQARIEQAQRQLTALFLEAKQQMEAHHFAEAIALLRKYIADPHATEMAAAQRLLAAAETAHSGRVNPLRTLNNSAAKLMGGGIDVLLHLKQLNELLNSLELRQRYSLQTPRIVTRFDEKLLDLRPTVSSPNERQPSGEHTRGGQIAFSPNGRMLAITYGGHEKAGRLEVLQVATGKRELLEEEFPSKIGVAASPLAFSADGTRLAADNGKGQVQIWDLSLDPIRRLKLIHTGGHAGQLAMSTDGSYLATWLDGDQALGREQGLKVFVVATGEALTLPTSWTERAGSNALWFNSAKTLLVLPNWILLDCETNKSHPLFPAAPFDLMPGFVRGVGHFEKYRCVWLSQDGSRLFTHMDSGGGIGFISPGNGVSELIIADLTALRETARILIANGYGTGRTAVAISADGTKLATVMNYVLTPEYQAWRNKSTDESEYAWHLVALWRVEDGLPKLVGQFKTCSDCYGPIAISPDGKSLAMIGNKNIVIWDLTQVDW